MGFSFYNIPIIGNVLRSFSGGSSNGGLIGSVMDMSGIGSLVESSLIMILMAALGFKLISMI